MPFKPYAAAQVQIKPMLPCQFQGSRAIQMIQGGKNDGSVKYNEVVVMPVYDYINY